MLMDVNDPRAIREPGKALGPFSIAQMNDVIDALFFADWTPEQHAEANAAIAQYKRPRHTRRR